MRKQGNQKGTALETACIVGGFWFISRALGLSQNMQDITAIIQEESVDKAHREVIWGLGVHAFRSHE